MLTDHSSTTQSYECIEEIVDHFMLVSKRLEHIETVMEILFKV
jgi:hypothetical protein